MYDAWLRSGDVDGASYAYLLHSSGAHNRSNAYRYYAVRPASSNAVNFKKVADTPRFLGLSLAHITPGCVPALATMRTLHAFSILLAALAAVTLIPALPCVPLHRMQ